MSLYPNTWRIFQELGWERFRKFNEDSESGCYDFFETRFNESIQTSQEIISGKLKNPEKILSYILILPNVGIRADLMQGTLTLPAIMLTEQYPDDNPVQRYFENSGQENVEQAIEMVLNSSIIDDCYRIASEYRDKACRNLHTLPGKEKRQALIDLAEYIIKQGK